MLAGKIGKGVQATEAAKAAVAKIENAVRREVITPNKLVRTPSSDLYDKSCYMNTEKFWKDNEVMAGVSERLNGMSDGEINNMYSKCIHEPNYPKPAGFRIYSRKAVDFDKLQSDYDVRRMNKLLEQGDLQKFADKVRKLARYKENVQQ